MGDPVVHFAIAAAGGAVVMPRTSLPGGPTRARFTDATGRLIGLLRRRAFVAVLSPRAAWMRRCPL